jgi:hypothetical protein
MSTEGMQLLCLECFVFPLFKHVKIETYKFIIIGCEAFSIILRAEGEAEVVRE